MERHTQSEKKNIKRSIGTPLTDKEREFLRKKTAHAVATAHRLHKKHGTWGLLKHGLLVGFGGLFLLFGLLFIWIMTQPIPDIDSFQSRKLSNSTTLLDRTGEVILYDIGESSDRTPVPSSEMSQNIKNAIIAIEDTEFYTHHGVRFDSTIRAVLATIQSKIGLPTQTQGGSTITQQLVKNTILTSDQSVTRKLKEWFLAFRLEQGYSKDEILAMYLNEVPFGGTIYGVETAAQTYFGVHASELSITQSAYLAALPNAPSLLNPYGKNRNKLDERKNVVLRRMYELNFITPDEYARARSEVVEFKPKRESSAKAIHFVEYIRNILENQYGENALTSQGYTVTTTLDWDIQKKAEDIVREQALKNEQEWDAENAGAIVLNAKTAEILAMVGSRGYEDPDIDGKFNVTLAHRQPGSSFKPIVYATAFEQGFTPETKLFDVRTQFSESCEPNDFTTSTDGTCYAPENYDAQYVGPVSLRSALTQSRNVPAVKLLYLVTPNSALRLAKSLGLRTLGEANRYGLSLVLGGGEVRLLDMAGAYAAFANEGKYHQPVGILKITNKDGDVLYEHTETPGDSIISPQSARQLSSVLSDTTGHTARGYMSFGTGRVAAAKTGTTNNNRDAWLIGYTPQIVTAVWVGNNNNTPMKKSSTIAGPTWHQIMASALSKYPFTPFTEPAPADSTLPPVLRGYWYGNESFIVDTISGGLATQYTPPETKKEVVMPKPGTILQFVTPGKPTQAPTNPNNDPQYTRWQYGVNRWIQNNPWVVPGIPNKPDFTDSVHTPEKQPRITIKNSAELGSVHGGTDIQIELETNSHYPITKGTVSIGGVIITEFSGAQNRITVSVPNETHSRSTITVEVVDSVYNRASNSIVTSIIGQ